MTGNSVEERCAVGEEGVAVLSRCMTLPRLLTWAQKGGVAVLDQGLFAGSNFLLNILLARWLEPAQYGAFAVTYSAFLLLAGFHTALLTEPMLIFGSGKYGGCFQRYLALLIYGHGGIMSVIMAVLAGAAIVCWRLDAAGLAQAAAGLAVASPFILLLWLLRRAFYVRRQPQWSASGGMLYLVILLAGIYGLFREERLSVLWALVIIGVASLAASTWLASLLRPKWNATTGEASLNRRVLTDHWKYGKWAAATAAISWVPVNIYYALLPSWVGLEGSAALKAMMNLIMPVSHATAAIGALLIPMLVNALRSGRKEPFYHLVGVSVALFSILSIAYWALLILLRDKVLVWMYGGRYTDQTHILMLVGLLPVIGGVATVLGSALRAVERPDHLFWCHLFAAFVTMTFGTWLLATHGIAGAVLGGLASSLATVLALIFCMAKTSPILKPKLGNIR
jgi:O-antigen/teichoic acid export membrane protein